MKFKLLNQCSFRCKLTNYSFFKLPLFFAACSALWLPSSMAAQSYAFTNLSKNAQPSPATDGTYVVTTNAAGDIIVYPFAGGTATTVVPSGTALPNGLGAATSFTAFGTPEVISDVVYFGAQSASGSGYYSVPVTGGAIHVIVDSTSKDASGRSVNAVPMPQDLLFGFRGVGLVPGIGSSLFVSPSRGATFAANLTSSATTQPDLAILNLPPSGNLTTVIDSGTLSGCHTISSFATDGAIFAAWAVTTDVNYLDQHLLLLESNRPVLSCSDVLLDLGSPNTPTTGTGILPGQLPNAVISAYYAAPATVIDSGYIYFSINMQGANNNAGAYSGIFRIHPGGSVEKVIATDNSSLGTPGTIDEGGASNPTNPLMVCSSFAVRGDYVVFATGWLTHYGWMAPGPYPISLFYLNQATGALGLITAANLALSPATVIDQYGLTAPTEAGLSADGKFTLEVRVGDYSSGPLPTPYNALYTVDLLRPGTTTTLTGPPSVPYGTPATLTATVAGSGSSAPTGQVSFFDSATVIGKGTLNSAGAATLAVTLAGGDHSLTAMYDGDSTYSASTFNGTLGLQVNPATPVLNLSSSASGATPAVTVTLTATAVGVAGAAVPTGTVDFMWLVSDKTWASLGTSSLSSTGVATLAVQNLPIGTDSITAYYLADANYSSVWSATTTINVAATSTYSLSSSSTSLTISQGQTGTATISLAPVGGFSAPVQFSCSGLPQYATCTFAPPSVTPGASVAKTTVTIATNVQTSELVWPSGLSYAAVLLLGFGAIRRTRNGIRHLSVPLFMILIAFVGAVAGCGGGSAGMSHVTPAGVSTVVVSATSGATVQTVNLTVTIAQN